MAADLYDVLIVGAGAAGIAAGRRLVEGGASFLLLEAADRIGGRALTSKAAGFPVDIGCGWLHSADRNPWTRLATSLGFSVDKSEPAWGRQFRNLGFTATEQEEAKSAFGSFDQRLRKQTPPSDRASDALDPLCPWNAYLEARSGFMNGAALNQVSIADYLAYERSDTGVNWRVPEGYGTLIESAGSGLPVMLSTPVVGVCHGLSPIKVQTNRGDLKARIAILAVPTTMIASEQLRFDPSLPAKKDAASALPLGLADKLFLSLEKPEELEPDSHLLGDPRDPQSGSYYLRPFGRPLIEAFFGGKGAAALEATGGGAMAEFAIKQLCALLGSNFRRRLHPVAGSAWAHHPFIEGAYSHACPGQAEARAVLAAPVDDRLFFAGEACSEQDFSTAHGAYSSGVSAAEGALEALARMKK